jgi:type I restriction enzyme S subunit
MAGEWQEKPLSSLCVYLSRGAAPVYTDTGGILVLNQKCVRDQRADFTLARRTDSQRKPVAADRMVQPFDILVNSTGVGTLGRVAQVRTLPEMATVDSHVTLVRPDSRAIDPLYLGLAIRCFESEIEALGEGSTGQTELSRARLGTFLVPMPTSLDEQRAIAHILGTLDDKIELNRRRNQTLEAMARALFQDWFVDFGPVRAKMEGRARQEGARSGQPRTPQASDLPWPGAEAGAGAQGEPYLPADLWQLFPDRLDDEGKPEGWGLVSASELIEFNPTEALRKGTPAPYLDMASLPTSGSWPEPPILREFGSGMRFRNGDTLLARITPCLENGKAAFVQCLPDNTVGWGSTEYIVMRPKAPVPAEYAYLLARDSTFREHAIRSMTGTSGRQRAQGDSVATFKLASPPDDSLWHAFARQVAPTFESIKSNARESETLAALRDTLLPKLISGELCITDAERFLEKLS